MDTVNRRILQALVGGTSGVDEDLAKRLSLSVASLKDRIRSMERKGIIRGYHLRGPAPAGGVHALAFLAAKNDAASLRPTTFHHEYVQAAYAGPGPFSLLVKLRGPDMATLMRFLEDLFDGSGHDVVRVRQLYPDLPGGAA